MMRWQKESSSNVLRASQERKILERVATSAMNLGIAMGNASSNPFGAWPDRQQEHYAENHLINALAVAEEALMVKPPAPKPVPQWTYNDLWSKPPCSK